MSKYKFLLLSVFLMFACKPNEIGFSTAKYDLYQELQFANGFALIKDQYGKRLDPYHDEKNYADGIMNASVMFGEMDLLKIKEQVIARMDNPDIEHDEEGIWRPLYDGVRQSHGHGYHLLDAFAYWLIFDPQVDCKSIGSSEDKGLIDMAILTAVSRANVAYWHKKISACARENLSSEQQKQLMPEWFDVLKTCHAEYADQITQMAVQIYPQLKTIPEYQKK